LAKLLIWSQSGIIHPWKRFNFTREWSKNCRYYQLFYSWRSSL